jgi:hypothetical protein
LFEEKLIGQEGAGTRNLAVVERFRIEQPGAAKPSDQP